MIPYGRHSISEADIDAVVEVLRSGWITQGPATPRFESLVSSYCGADYGVAVSSGTAALHLACLALGLGPGDALWTSPNSFVASANCALYCGASVDFVDIDPHTYNMSVTALRTKLEQARSQGTLPKIVVPVHFAGQPCDMKEIAGLADEYGFHVIEDACHALGATYEDQQVGNCRYSDITVFSFHPVKMITTGEGGVLLTNNKDLHERAGRLHNHGIVREGLSEEGGWFYEQHELGFNYRITDIQGVLGISQLSRLNEYLSQRRELAARYNRLLEDLPLERPYQEAGRQSSWHLYVVQVPENSGWTRQSLYEELRNEGVGVNVHYIPVHTQPYYQRLGFQYGQFPLAEAYYGRALTLPLYPGLSEMQQDHVVASLEKFVGSDESTRGRRIE